MKKERVLIIHDVRSAYNVGSIFRTAEAAGVKKIFLTGYTPSPKDNYGRDRKDIPKVALGAEKIVPWEKGDVFETIQTLKKDGFKIVSIEQDKKAVPHLPFKVPKKVAYILGNEVEGLSPEVLGASDAIVEIVMKGKKESLNVSVAAGVILFSS